MSNVFRIGSHMKAGWVLAPRLRKAFVCSLLVSCLNASGIRAQGAGKTAEKPLAARLAPCARQFFPGKAWKHERHNAEDWSPQRLSNAEQYAASVHDKSFMVVRCGKVVEEWGESAKTMTTFSVRKSLLSALYGVYATEGKIDLNETLEQAGINDEPSPLTHDELQAKIVDLLRARSGVYHDAGFEVDFQRKMRPARGSHAPGTFWFYNNWDFNVLGTIFEKKIGMSIGEAFYRRIARPIGMQDFRPADVYYVGDKAVSQHPAYMFRMSTRDLARFGLLYLNEGRWKGKQIVPANWVYKSSHTNEMVSLGTMKVGGYEYLWWLERNGVHFGLASIPGMYSAEGAGGHYVVDIPSWSTVIVNQYENEPANRTVQGVLLAAQDKNAMFDEQFDQLARLILDAYDPPTTAPAGNG